MKKYILSIFIFNTIGLSTFAQWQTPTIGTGNFGVNGHIKVTSSGTSVGGDNNYRGYLVNHNNFYTASSIINQAFTEIPTQNLLKAEAGVPITIDMEVVHQYFADRTFGPDWATTHQVFIDYFSGDCFTCSGDWYSGTIGGFQGKNEQPYLYDDAIQFNRTASYQATNDPIYGIFARKSTFSQTFTFPVGRTRGWIVFGFREKSYTVYNQSSYNNFVVIPFVVEGPKVSISEANPLAIMGTFKEAAIPQLILHNPPGDGSTVTFQTNQETCRNISESLKNTNSASGNLKVTLGIAGQAGLFVTTKFEFSASVEASFGGGKTQVRSSGQKNCLSIQDAVSTKAGVARANEGSIYLGYSSDIAYGMFPRVFIESSTGSPPQVKVDTNLLFGLVPGSETPFYFSKTEMKNNMARLRVIADTASIPRVKYESLNQADIWAQVLEKDSINVNSQTNEVLENYFDFSANSDITSSTTLSLANSDSYEVSHFIDASVGTSFVVNVGGSGVSGGFQFKTNKTVGATVQNTSNTSTTIAYKLSDNDTEGLGDKFRVRIVKDPTYGTPIFQIDSANSRSSAPYEGGYPRDQPRFEIVGTTKKDTTISNISLGTSGSFLVRACNDNVQEPRTYDFGFLGQSIANDLRITSAGSEGNQLPTLPITRFLKITNIPEGGCQTGLYDVNMSRRNPASAVNYSDIEFQLFAEKEATKKSSLFANISFATPPPPTGVAASLSEICTGTPVTLTANCPVTTTPTWYNVPIGGFPIAQGESIVVNPTTNTTYFVGCETPDYKRDRVATQLVLVGSPSTVLNLTSDFSDNSLEIANTSLTATNKINSPSRVTYKAGNSLTFNPGFEAKSGSTFEAKVGGCPD